MTEFEKWWDAVEQKHANNCTDISPSREFSISEIQWQKGLHIQSWKAALGFIKGEIINRSDGCAFHISNLIEKELND